MTKYILITMAALLLFASGPKQQELKNEIGVAIAWQRGQDWANQSLETLGQPIWHNWVYDNINDERYYPKLFSLPPSQHDNFIQIGKQYKHKIWLIGNEPENASSITTPQDMAQFTIKWTDEVGAKFACCGVIIGQNWPYGLQWMDRYIAEGGAIPDYWHIHLYFHYNEARWQQSLDQFIAWTKEYDIERPIIISETAFTETYQDNKVDILAAKNLLKHIDKQVKTGVPYTVFWYSDIDYWSVWPQSNLLNEQRELTELGELFVELNSNPILYWRYLPNLWHYSK